MHELRFAFRTLTKTPFVTLVAIVSLALGIGANTAMFSLFDKVLLRLLPVEDPKSLVVLRDTGPRSGSVSNSDAGNDSYVFSYPMFRDLQKQNHLFTGIFGHRDFGANLSFRGQSVSGEGLLVSGNFFDLLGVRPAIGRLLTEGDDRTIGAHNVVVLAHHYWTERFGSNPAVLNEALLVNGQPMTIIGVTPEHFKGVTLTNRPSIYVPISMKAAVTPGWKGFEEHRTYWVYLMARLKPGVPMTQAQEAANAGYRGLIQEEVALQKGSSPRFLERFKKKQLLLEKGEQGESSMAENAATPMLLLFGMTGFVLLIACANIANLMLARAAGRSREIAIRLSVGASRGQLVRQLLLESCLLALTGGLAGLVVSTWTVDAIRSFLPQDALYLVSADIDGRMLLFTLLVSLVTGVLFGLFPALQSTRPDLAPALKDGSGQSSVSVAAAYYRKALVVAQIGFSLLLLVCSGLFALSLVNVTRADLGLRTDHLIVFGLSPELSKYKPEQSIDFFGRVEETVGGLPGVTMVSGSMVPLLAGNNWGSNVTVEGFQAGPDTDTHSMYNEVGTGFFRTLGMPLVEGREFTQADHRSAPQVAIVNEAFVRKFIPDGRAVGRLMVNGGGKPTIQIVGVAKDAKYSEVKHATPPLFYLPYAQDKRIGSLSFYVRTSVDPVQLMPAIRRAVTQLDPNLPIENLQTMEATVDQNIFLDRMITTLATTFAMLATLLAAVGLYGVLAYMVSRRTREIGIRLALGATSATVRKLVLGEVALLLLLGILIGLPAAVGLGRLFESLLFGLKSYDLRILGGSTLAMALVCLAAGYIPAWRATRIHPMTALRQD